MKKNRYSLSRHIDELYMSRTVVAPTARTFFDWQRRKRSELKKILAVPELRVVRSEKAGSLRRGNMRITLLDLYLNDGTIMPLYRAERARKGPFRPMVMYHGHSDGAQTLFGFHMTKPRQDYAIPFIERGYTVFAPDMRGFRRRLGPSPIEYAGYTRSCRQLAFDLLLMGKTLLGERVGDCMALADWVRRVHGDSFPLIVAGNSGGGTLALLHAALDTRIDAAIAGSSFCSYKESIMELSHCECNYIPGLLEHFNEIFEVGGLMAPRPLLVIHGAKDPIFPVRGARTAVKGLRRLYAYAQAKKENVTLHVHPGAHWFDHTKVFSFLDRFYGT